jgi:guanylate kinase
MKEDASKKLVIITAPSGSGKSTVVNFLLKELPQLSFSVSACTRAPRGNEQQGVHYYFLSLEEFTRKIANHEFAEFEMVYEGKYYGTLKQELERIWSANKIPLIDIDVQGALRLVRHYGKNACSIFIQAPSIALLEERLRKRATDNEASIIERIQKATVELSFKNQFDHIVVNDMLPEACKQTYTIITQFLAD